MVKTLVMLSLVLMSGTTSYAQENPPADTDTAAPASPAHVKPNPTPSQTCALNKIMTAMKDRAQKKYANGPTAQHSPQAIRLTLQEDLHIPVETGEAAVDYMKNLTKNNLFTTVDAQTERDAPPGSIIIYAGPKSSDYLQGKKPTSPQIAGDFYGDMKVKGANDSTYYGDGIRRGAEHANRKVIGVFIPGPSVIKQLGCQGSSGGQNIE